MILSCHLNARPDVAMRRSDCDVDAAKQLKQRVSVCDSLHLYVQSLVVLSVVRCALLFFHDLYLQRQL